MSVHLKPNNVEGPGSPPPATVPGSPPPATETRDEGRFIVPVRDAGFGFGLWPWAKGPLWRITRAHGFVMKVEGFKQWYMIPAGYEFDKASVPAVFWGFPFGYTPDGLATIPALEHDFLCDLLTGGSDWLRERLELDDLVVPPAALVHRYFEQRLLADGVRPGKAKVMGRAVRWFGPGGKFRRRID